MSSSRDRLVAAMQDLMWERGYGGVSPRDVQAAAGAGQGSMYHHFAGKAELGRAAMDASADALIAEDGRVLDQPGPVLERIAAYLRVERPVLRGCRLGRLTEDADVVADPELRAPVERLLGWSRERLAALLDEGRQSGELRADLDPASVAATLVAVLQGGFVLAKAAADPQPFHDAVAGVLALLAAQQIEPT